MNNTFQWSRFGQVVKKDFLNIWPTMGSTMLLFVLLPLICWLGKTAYPDVFGDSYLPEQRLGMIGMLVVLTSILTPSRLYKHCNGGKEGIYFAMLPASKLEKYLSMLLFSIVVCPLMVNIGSYLLDILLTILPVGPYKEWLWSGTENKVFINEQLLIDEQGHIDPSNRWMTYGFYAIAALTSLFWSSLVFLFSNTVFKRHKVSKTIIISLGVIFLLSVVVLAWIGSLIYPGAEYLDLWSHGYVEGTTLTWIVWGVAFVSFLLCVLLVWWTGRRLKRMCY